MSIMSFFDKVFMPLLLAALSLVMGAAICFLILVSSYIPLILLYLTFIPDSGITRVILQVSVVVVALLVFLAACLGSGLLRQYLASIFDSPKDDYLVRYCLNPWYIAGMILVVLYCRKDLGWMTIPLAIAISGFSIWGHSIFQRLKSCWRWNKKTETCTVLV